MMEYRPIPIEELKSGEFYDIQVSDTYPNFLGALLLEKLPNKQAKLMLMSSSDFDNFPTSNTQLVLKMHSLQIEVLQLGRVYPYLTFTRLFSGAFKWPNQYEGEELICQIKEEMCRAVSEGCWTFHLPHFCEGYLQVYLSYLCWNENCLNRGELIDLWFEFMGSFFSVLRDHILRVKLLSTENSSELLKAVKGMDQMLDVTLEIKKDRATFCNIEQSLKLEDVKTSFFDSYRPIELSAAMFDGLWKLIMQEYHQYLITSQLQEPLSLRCLFLNPDKLIEIISRYRYLAIDLLDVDVPGLDPEEIIKVKFRIAVATQLLHLADDLIEHSGISAEESSRIIVEEALIEPILINSRQTLQDLVQTRSEMVPSVLAYLKSILRGTIHLTSLLQCITARIAVEDWQFITFLIAHNSLELVEIRKQIDAEETRTQIKELIRVSLKQRMSAELLRDLLPCETYGPLVFPALAEGFPLPHCREVMITYLRTKRKCIFNSFSCKMHYNICRFLTAAITSEDWELVNLVIQNSALSPANCNNPLLDNDVKGLVSVALEHQINGKLLERLFPRVDYRETICKTLVKRFSFPNCRELMTTYLRAIPEYTSRRIKFSSKTRSRICTFLTAAVALEDWKLFDLVVHKFRIAPARWADGMLAEDVKGLVCVALEHKMRGELLEGLLPCVTYGHLVFPAFAERFELLHCRQMMLTYFKPEQWKNDTSNSENKLFSFLKTLTTQISLKNWEFISFILQNATLRPKIQNCHMNNQDLYVNVAELVHAALEHQLSADLLRDLLPCVDYGHLVFSALAEGFSLPYSNEVMITYFTHEQWPTDMVSSQAMERFLSFVKSLTARIVAEDWEFVTLLVKQKNLALAKHHSFLHNQEFNAHVKDLVKVALEHKMSVELLKNLLPDENYGYVVLAALIEGILMPHSRVVMLNYFKLELPHAHINYYRDHATFCSFLKFLQTRIEYEDWELLNVVNRLETFPPKAQPSILNSPQVYKHVAELVRVALEHKLSGDLLRNMLPCKDYGQLVFPSFLKGFLRARSFQTMVSYFGSESVCIGFARELIDSISKVPEKGMKKKSKRGGDRMRPRCLKDEKLDLWYMFGGSVQIQLIWMKQSSSGFIKRLTPALTREVCNFLA